MERRNLLLELLAVAALGVSTVAVASKPVAIPQDGGMPIASRDSMDGGMSVPTSERLASREAGDGGYLR